MYLPRSKLVAMTFEQLIVRKSEVIYEYEEKTRFFFCNHPTYIPLLSRVVSRRTPSQSLDYGLLLGTLDEPIKESKRFHHK